MTTADEVELRVTGIAAGGDGVGRTNGIVVFVPRAAPGDLALVSLAHGRHFARGRLQTLLEASPDRVEPPCAHYTKDRCGGCQLQHLSYDAQLAAKGRIIGDALQRIARLEVGAPSVQASERQWRYRSKLTLTVRRTGRGWVAGLHPYDDPVAVFRLRDCPITDERIMTVWRDIFSAARYYPEVATFRAAVRLAGEHVVCAVEGGSRWRAAEAFFQAVPSLAALWWTPTRAERRLIASREAVPAGASFAQINRAVVHRLRDHVVARARAHRPTRVVDAYAGTGDTSVELASADVRVIAIESDPDAVEVCRHRLPAGSVALRGRVEDVVQQALPAEVVVVNPPRAGMHPDATAALAAADPKPRAVLYASCNPATLARDITRLVGYRVASTAAFDMFPQTAHVETVCELTPAS